MLPDRKSNPGPLTYESGALPIALRGPAFKVAIITDLGLFLPLKSTNQSTTHLDKCRARLVGLLFWVTALGDNISVYIEPSPKEREKEEKE